MFCCNCGNQLLAYANFCPECGVKIVITIVDYNKLQTMNNLMCYEGKPYSGAGVAYYCNGKKKHEESFKQGLKHGQWSYWYEDGIKGQEIQYTDNEIDGVETEWYENSQKKSQVNWSRGILNGLWVFWYKNGQKEGEVLYKNGKKNGKEKTWYENGQMNSKGEWKNGKQVGLWTVWNPNGQQKWQGTY